MHRISLNVLRRALVQRSVVLARASTRLASRNFSHSAPLASGGNVIPFNLPDIGEGIAEVEVLQWFVKEGQTVKQFERLLEVQSDKATVEITSRYDGTITKIHYQVGEMAKTGTPLLDIQVAGAAAPEVAKGAPAAAAPEVAREQASGTVATSASNSLRTLATPAVRRIARENNIQSLDVVPGTGKDGRVTKEDILNYIARGGAPAAPAPSAAAPAPAAPAPAGLELQPLPPVTHGIPEDQRVPIRGIQRAMVKSMTAAWEVPHFGYCDEIYLDGLMQTREVLKPLAAAKGLKLTYLPLIIKATSMALKTAPGLNAQLSTDASEVIHKGSHNIGVAMDTPRGLIVPVIKGVQERSIFEIAHELARLQALASAGKLGEADLSDCTFRYALFVFPTLLFLHFSAPLYFPMLPPYTVIPLNSLLSSSIYLLPLWVF